MANAIYIIYQKTSHMTIPYVYLSCKYLFTRMAVIKRIKLWRKDDMVRAIVMVRDWVPTREAAETCNQVMCPESRLDGI